MMLFFSRTKDELLLILDIQSSVARSALVLVKVGANPNILFTRDVVIPHQDSGDSSRLVSATIKAATQAVDEATKYLSSMKQSGAEGISLPRKVSAVHYVLSSPWILSEAKRLDVTFDKQKIITQDLVSKMVRDEREKMATEVRAKDKTTEVEEKIFGIELNGYHVSNWNGKTAENLSVSFVTSISGIRMVERFKEICAHMVNSRKIHFHSSLLLQHIGIGNIFPDKDTYAIVHVHGEITDIVEVEKRSCVFFGTYPIGTQTTLRSFSEASKMSLQTAESALNLHSSGAIDQGSSGNDGQIKIAYDLWMEQLDRSLKSGHLNHDGPISLIISASERQDDFTSLLTKRYPRMKVSTLSIDDVTSHVSYSRDAERSVMIGLYAIATNSLRP